MWVSSETDQTSKGLFFVISFTVSNFLCYFFFFFFWLEIGWNFQVIKGLMHLCFISYEGLLVYICLINFDYERHYSLVSSFAASHSLVLLFGLLDNL